MTRPCTYYLFVYGSLRSGFKHPAYQYISHYFHFVAPARVKGRLYDLGSFPAALPADDEEFIIGELYRLKHADEFGWAMAQLDDYEGVDAGTDDIPLYRRDTATVYFEEGTVEAWIYWFNGSITNQPQIPSGDVLEYRQAKNIT